MNSGRSRFNRDGRSAEGVCLAWGRQSGQRVGIAGDDVSYDDAVLSQGCAQPYPLRLAGLIPYVLQPLRGRSANASRRYRGRFSQTSAIRRMRSW